MTQKARGVGTIVLHAVRSGSGVRERVELVDVSAPAPAPAPAVDLTAELERLASFNERGLLDDEEFAAAKRKLLGL
jgi:hypothetical protein